jgi:hypothetical protein
VSIQPFHEPAPTYQPTDTWVPVLTAVGDLAAKLAGTQFVPRALQRQPAAVAAAILTGREMGLGPMASLRGIDVIEGRPSLTAQMLAARIFAAGHTIEWVKASDRACTVRITRGDGLSTAEVTWSLADAQRAGLAGKKVWQQYPRHMLRARALSECASMACPDVALGIDVAETDAPEQRPEASRTTVMQLPESVQNADQTGENPAAVKPQYQRSEVAVTENTTENTTETEPQPDLITTPQMRKMSAQIRELEQAEGRKLDHAERRTFIAGLAGIEHLESAKHLTKQQASDVIEALDRAIGDKPQGDPETGDAEQMSG